MDKESIEKKIVKDQFNRACSEAMKYIESGEEDFEVSFAGFDISYLKSEPFRRAIKFRIWDMYKKEWLGESDNNACTWKNFSLRGGTMAMQEFPTPDILDHCEIEQWSGAKDKNGKDIYEGDIVHGLHSDFVVRFVEYYGGFVAQNSDDEETIVLGDNNARLVEIIGNIHETPEKHPETRTGCRYE